MKLYLIRHLATSWNKLKILQGRKDISIIDDILPKLPNLPILSDSLVLTSPLKRTQESSIKFGYKNHLIEPLLIELDFGEYEGEKKSLLVQNLGNAWLERPSTITLGEPLLNLQDRILKVLIKYKNIKNLIIFGHGNWIRAAFSLFNYGNIDHMNKLTLENGEVVKLNIENKKLMDLMEKTYHGNDSQITRP